MGQHDGHRARLRERFRKDELEGFAPHEILELLLMYAIPRRNVNDPAHNIVRHFGSWTNAMEASVDELQKVEGVGETSAVLIHLVTKIWQRYSVEKLGRPILENTLEQAEFCKALFLGMREETIYLVALNAYKKLVAVHKLDEGIHNDVPFYISKIMEQMLLNKAALVIFTHNHPGGFALPSEDDVRTTHKAISLLRAIGVHVEDCIIIGDNGEWLSMRESGVL